jgi:ABC-type nitrate/sulfonate/bicarbonate transport system permease component
MTAASRSAPRRSTWQRIGPVAEPVLAVCAFTGLFEILAQTNALGRDLLPPIEKIASSFATDVTHGALWSATWITMRSWAIGMAIVVAVGVPVGLACGSSRLAYHALHLPVEILRTIPSIAALPFLVLVYGVGSKLTVILVVLTALWPLLLQTMLGVRDVDPVALDTARCYGLGRARQFRQVSIPSALPYIVTGLRLSATFGLLLAIATSMFAGGAGLGNQIFTAQEEFNTPLLFARTIFAGLLGLIVYYVLIAFERRSLAWHASHRRSA